MVTRQVSVVIAFFKSSILISPKFEIITCCNLSVFAGKNFVSFKSLNSIFFANGSELSENSGQFMVIIQNLMQLKKLL